LFALPPFWKAMPLDLAPTLKQTLVTHAYTTFFQRTFANFEALLEGRDISIGRAWHDPEQPPGTEPTITESLVRSIGALLEKHGPLLARTLQPRATATPVRIDEEGFAHFAPGSSPPQESEPTEELARLWSELLAGLAEAFRRDLQAQSLRPQEAIT
jgi:hypothetical protein